jgi:hypothetical protein
MDSKHTDSSIQQQIEAARSRSLDWFRSMQAPGYPEGVSRVSPCHDENLWPGMLFPGTYNATMARALLEGMESWTKKDRDDLANWVLSHRRDDGIFKISGMRDEDVFKKPDPVETWRYIDFHVTNYGIGALAFLRPEEHPKLDFVLPWLDPTFLKAWLAERDLRDPWQEGNNIVNLCSFLLLLAGDDHRQAAAVALHEIFEWHYRLQEPATGFWGVGQFTDKLQALHAMAGSMHNFHLWYALGEKLPYQDKSVDFALAQAPRIVSACIDVDLVDLLIHAHSLIDYRRADIELWLREILARLLAFQNVDGGFADTLEGSWRQDGWVRGYEEPQGVSNAFATWFRWIAIAMIADCLWPGWKRWNFRGMIGIGYRKPLCLEPS